MTNHAMFSLYIMTGLLALVHVSPHVRRAHWHGYWLGKRDNPTDLVIKWIAPVIVNGGNGELLGRVHVGNGD